MCTNYKERLIEDYWSQGSIMISGSIHNELEDSLETRKRDLQQQQSLNPKLVGVGNMNPQSHYPIRSHLDQ